MTTKTQKGIVESISIGPGLPYKEPTTPEEMATSDACIFIIAKLWDDSVIVYDDGFAEFYLYCLEDGDLFSYNVSKFVVPIVTRYLSPMVCLELMPSAFHWWTGLAH